MLYGAAACCLAQGLPDRPYIQVTGRGTVTAEPDVATIRMNIAVTDESSAVAQAEANGRFDDLRDMLVALGIDSEDIVAGSISVFQRFSSNDFTASRDVSVTVHNIEQVDEVLNAGTTAGVTSVAGVSFSSSRQPDLLQQARENAIEDSRVKAAELVSSYGATLGPIWRISYSSSIGGGTVTGSSVTGTGGFNAQPGVLRINDEVHIIYLLGEAAK